MALPAFSSTVTLVTAKLNCMSSSVMVTVVLVSAPRSAPPLGFPSTRLKDSWSSTTWSSTTCTRRLLLVWPGTKFSTCVKGMKSNPPTAVPATVAMSTDTAPMMPTTRFTVTVTLPDASATV